MISRVETLKKEIGVLEQLKHPNIIRYYNTAIVEQSEDCAIGKHQAHLSFV